MGHSQSKAESFFSKQPRDVHVLDQVAAADILSRAELVDNYRGSCAACRLNATARAGQDYSARPPSTDTVPFLAAIESFPAWLRDYLPPILYIAFLANSADGGMPHTRPQNIVCLPQYFNPEGAAGRETFMHECVHIHQRTYPDIWDRIYRTVFHMEPYRGPLPDALETRRRYNPDTSAEPLYMWRSRWVAVPAFSRPEQPQLGAVKILYYNVKTGAWQAFMPPEMVAEFGDLSVAQAEHPAELAAYLLSGGAAASSQQAAAIRQELEQALIELLEDSYV